MVGRTRTWAKRIGVVVFGSLLLLAAVLGWNLSNFHSLQLSVEPVEKIALDEAALLERLSGAIQIPTISVEMARLTMDSELHRFRDYIEQTFPRLVAEPFVRRTGIDFDDALNPSLLLEWPGRDPSLPGILLMSHLDVVPIASDSLSKWTHPPFSGHWDNTFVWGRGTLDCKHGVMAILEAVSHLATKGFQPERTIFIALGHDEELGGEHGSAKIAEWFRSRGYRFEMILDEGGCVFTEFPGLDRPAALIGVAEKGVLNVRLSVDMDAQQVGHASMPPMQTAVGILAVAVAQVQASPFPMRINGGLAGTLRFLGPEMPSVASRIAMSNLWLCESLVKAQLSSKPTGNALIRTTVAPTMIDGGVRENVLPDHASATLNIRILPGDTQQSVVDHLRNAISDVRVEIEVLSPSKEASAISSTDTQAFTLLNQTIRQIYPDAVVAPFVLVGATDSSHYSDRSDAIYRFIPARLSERDSQRFHGIDERIAIKDYLDIVCFYQQLIRNTAGR